VEVVAGNAEQRNSRRPGTTVALGNQLAARPQPKPGNVRVREESLDATARVIAHLKRRINAVVAQVEVPPSLEANSGW
jgi:hypothetical protein